MDPTSRHLDSKVFPPTLPRLSIKAVLLTMTTVRVCPMSRQGLWPVRQHWGKGELYVSGR